MKRFQLWLTTAIMFSLPALVFAQATGGSPGKQGKLIKNGTAAGTGRKGTVEPEGNAQKKAVSLNPQPLPPIIHATKKGSGNAQKKAVTLNPQPLPPIIHATKKGSGNAPKTTGTTTPPPKRETQPARFIEKVAVPAGKAELSKPTAAKKGSNAPEAPRSKGN